MDQMMDMMVTYANNLEELVGERTRLLYEEKNKTEDLLHRMLPKYDYFLRRYNFKCNINFQTGCCKTYKRLRHRAGILRLSYNILQ